MTTSTQIKELVKEKYGQIANQSIKENLSSCCGATSSCCGDEAYTIMADDYKDLDRSVNPDEIIDSNGYCLMIHGNVLPTKELVRLVRKLRDGEFVSLNGSSGIVFRFSRNEVSEKHKVKVSRALHIAEEIKTIRFPWDIFQMNDFAIREDYELITRKRKSRTISKTNRVTKPSQVFLEKGARVEHCIINAETGPVYIGKNAEVMEGSVVRITAGPPHGTLIGPGAALRGSPARRGDGSRAADRDAAELSAVGSDHTSAVSAVRGSPGSDVPADRRRGISARAGNADRHRHAPREAAAGLGDSAHRRRSLPSFV